jgi:hypothetical protein
MRGSAATRTTTAVSRLGLPARFRLEEGYAFFSGDFRSLFESFSIDLR